MTATLALTRDPVMEARCVDISSILGSAAFAGMPVPASLTVSVGGSDEDAREQLDLHSVTLTGTGVRHRMFEDRDGFGLVITGGAASVAWYHERVANPPLAVAS